MKIQLTQDHPRYARLTKDIVVDAEPVGASAKVPPDLMRVKNFGEYENGALVHGEAWELVFPDEEFEALLNEG